MTKNNRTVFERNQKELGLLLMEITTFFSVLDWMSAGMGNLKSALFVINLEILCPSRDSSRPRRTVSTSGSSGMGSGCQPV